MCIILLDELIHAFCLRSIMSQNNSSYTNFLVHSIPSNINRNRKMIKYIIMFLLQTVHYHHYTCVDDNFKGSIFVRLYEYNNIIAFNYTLFTMTMPNSIVLISYFYLLQNAEHVIDAYE